MASGRFEYVNFPNYLFLTFLRIWAWAASLFFFRRFRVTGRQHIPKEGPVIFAVNHQSAFLDPVLIGITSGRKPWYLTRAGVFKGKLVRFILNAIHMLPVYRLRDQVNIIDANRSTFAACHRILSGNGSVLIFPEGNHGMQKRLRTPLKKGIARIALEAEAMNDFMLEIKIVPVGINYEHPTKFRTDVLINYGEAFTMTKLKEAYHSNPSEALNSFTRELERHLRPLVLDIHPKQDYDALERLWMEHRKGGGELTQRFRTDKEIISKIRHKENLSDPVNKPEVSILLKALLMPFIAGGLIANLPSYLLTMLILKKTVIDPHFRQSIMFACGMVLVPIFMILKTWIIYNFFGPGWAIAGLVIMPLWGMAAYDAWDLYVRKQVFIPTRLLARGFLPD